MRVVYRSNIVVGMPELRVHGVVQASRWYSLITPPRALQRCTGASSGTTTIVMPGVGPQRYAEMAHQRPAAGACTRPAPSVPSVRRNSCLGCPWRSLHGPYALAGEGLIERAGELGVVVPDEEPERADPAGEVHDQVAGLLGRPCTVWVPGHPGDVHPAGSLPPSRTARTALEEDHVRVKKSHASTPSAWARREVRQEVSRPRGTGR